MQPSELTTHHREARTGEFHTRFEVKLRASVTCDERFAERHMILDLEPEFARRTVTSLLHVFVAVFADGHIRLRQIWHRH